MSRFYWHSYKLIICIIIELEWMLGQAEAVPTKITKDPKPKVRDVLFSVLRHESDDKYDDVADSNDW